MNIMILFLMNIIYCIPVTANNQLWDCFHKILKKFLSNFIQFPFGFEESGLISELAILSPILCFYFVQVLLYKIGTYPNAFRIFIYNIV